jgi:homospermidine synthase
MIKLTNIIKEDTEITKSTGRVADNPFDNSEYNFLDYDELDVEEEDEEDFLNFLKNYTSELQEANCNCVYEAEYQGREVKLGKPMQGDVKKFKVYVKNPKTGKVVKVNFGQKGMNIKKNNPDRRKSFRARMNCDQPGPRTKARYWSCRKW